MIWPASFELKPASFEFRAALVQNQHVRRGRAILLVGGEFEPFDQQRLKHRRNLISSRTFQHFGDDVEAISMPLRT
jgi:hypothetical protein